ncbi:MAG: DNA-binding protein [Nanoarchaeota archaeon]
MNINKLIQNKELLEEYYLNYTKRKILLKSFNSNQLKFGHLEKANHNLYFFKTIKDNSFDDWKIVVLYYCLYHSFLALVENKGYSSKNHNATIVFILKNYVEINKEDIEILEKLNISQEDAMFYTTLKEKRNEASYSIKTNIKHFDIDTLAQKVTNILLKIKEIINND